MAFVNLSLLLGGALVAIPIVLHLVMRQQPKRLEFPALRLLKQHREANRRTLQLRHWLLLILRCGAIGLLAAALAGPSVSSLVLGNWLLIGVLGGLLLLVVLLFVLSVAQHRGRLLMGGLGALGLLLAVCMLVLMANTLAQVPTALIGDQEAPVSAVLLLDTSPRTEYRHRNKTRLDVARETAAWLLAQLPADSEIAVLDTRAHRAAGRVPERRRPSYRQHFAVDRGTAKKTIQSLLATGAARGLTEGLRDALDLVRTGENPRKEVYIFTDLTEAAWPAEAAGPLRQSLQQAKDVLLYVIDVGVKEPRNFALGDLRLSSQILSRNTPLNIQTELVHQGPGGERAVELVLEDFDPTLPIVKDGKPLLPKARRRSRQICRVGANSSRRIELHLRGLEVGTHHGWVKIVGQDGLALDDVRFFTVQVRPPWPILVAAPADADTTFLTEALAPYEFRATGQARFRCEVIPLAELSKKKLDDHAVVCLLDPTPLVSATWKKLAAYARRGGSVAIFLGRNAMDRSGRANPVLQEPPARQLLLGKLGLAYHASGQELFLAPRQADLAAHPMLARFRGIGSTTAWYDFPIHRYWTYRSRAPGSKVVLPYSNGKPALVERPLGAGRVVVMTSPISDPLNVPGRQAWNLLPTGTDSWPFLVLANEMMLYLAGSGDAKLNYLAGQRAVLHVRGENEPGVYHLFSPNADKPQQLRVRQGEIAVSFTHTPGTYRIKSAGDKLLRGFSVNLPLSASRLDRTTPQRLDEILGEGRYQLARGRDEINRGIGESRVGREFYPFLILLVATVLALEHTLANRFYRKKE